MTAIAHSELLQYLDTNTGTHPPTVYLIHGQEMLVEQAVERVVRHLLGDAQRDLCVEVVAGLAENVADALAQMNTFALLAGPKIVLFKDAKLFDARSEQSHMLDQIVEAYEAGHLSQAAVRFEQLCGRLGVDLAAVRQDASPFNELAKVLGQSALIQIADYCLDHPAQPLSNHDAAEVLRQAVEKGFPHNHYLVVSANTRVPKNLKLYKTMAQNGLVVDCHVPTGERRADKLAQEAVMRQSLEQQLASAGKKLAPGLFENLCQLTGFDPRTFTQNIEKLIDYSGERSEITAEDIHHVLRRTKSDPVFELTNAVADRNKVQALFFLNTLLKTQWHPLQVLSAVANQIRKLLVAKDFALGMGRRIWSAGMSFQQFQQAVMPTILAYDAQTQEMIHRWKPSDRPGTPAKKGKGATGVVLAPKSHSAYPVYQTMLKSEKFTLHELVTALELIGRSDLRLKSSTQDPAVVITKTLVGICDGDG